MTIMAYLAALCLLVVPTALGFMQVLDFSRERKQR